MGTIPKDIATYLRQFAPLLEDRILKQFPPLHEPGSPLPAELRRLRRTPYPAQSLAIAGISRRWAVANSAGCDSRVWNGKDSDLSRRDARACKGTSVYGARHGAAAIDHEVVPRVPVDAAPGTSLPD